MSNSWRFGKNGLAVTCSKVVNSNLSDVLKINRISSWLFRVMILLAVVLNGSMRINASSGIEDHCIVFPSIDCDEVGIQSEIDDTITEPDVFSRELENPLMNLLRDRSGSIELLSGWCYMSLFEDFDDDILQLHINCDLGVRGNEDFRKLENADLELFITKFWNMMIIGVDSEIRDGIINYLIAGDCIQFNVNIVQIDNFQDGNLTCVWRNKDDKFAFKVFPDMHVEKVEVRNLPKYEILPIDDDVVKEDICIGIIRE